MLDHLTCNGILRLGPNLNEVKGFIGGLCQIVEL